MSQDSVKVSKKFCQNTHVKEFFPRGILPVGLRKNQDGIVLVCQQKSRYKFNHKKSTTTHRFSTKVGEFQYIQATNSHQKT